jgi:hypothetical protein
VLDAARLFQTEDEYERFVTVFDSANINQPKNIPRLCGFSACLILGYDALMGLHDRDVYASPIVVDVSLENRHAGTST